MMRLLLLSLPFVLGPCAPMLDILSPVYEPQPIRGTELWNS